MRYLQQQLVFSHPCHPSVFNWEPTEKGFRDFYGGITAKQAIVVALMWGEESFFDLGVAVSTAMYAPVSRVHRVTLEQMVPHAALAERPEDAELYLKEARTVAGLEQPSIVPVPRSQTRHVRGRCELGG